MAAILNVDATDIERLEKGLYVQQPVYERIKNGTEMYIRDQERGKYLSTRIIEEALQFQQLQKEEAGNEAYEHVVAHMNIHVAKLLMMLTEGKNID